MTHSMNDNVYFKLTRSGHEILNKKAEEFHREHPEIDIQYKWQPWHENWYREQLHEILGIFGGRKYIGTLLPIYDITFEQPEIEEKEE